MHTMTLAFFLIQVALIPIISAQSTPKVVCAYNHKSYYREDSGRFLTADLEHSLAHCTHILYQYAKVDDDDFRIKSSDSGLDIEKENYKAVTGLKKRFPGLRVLLSVGGWNDEAEDKSERYLAVLRDPDHRAKFISSAHTYVTTYGFDGIDLAWQFPLVRVKERNALGSIWHKVKKTFGYSKGSKDPQAEEHRAGFTALIKQMRMASKADGLLVTASVIPHTNYTVYWDAKEVTPYLDAIHIQAYDYLTPERKITPEVADYPAPLYATYDRNPVFNVDAQVRWFLDHGAQANKLILGIATYGRSWKLDVNSEATGVPPLEADGEGAEGHLTRRRGLLSYPEICSMSLNSNNHGTKGLLRKVTDPANKLGTYAFRAEDGDREGLWVGYEDEDTAKSKADYARRKNLGGIGIFDLTMDDFRGVCNGQRYPLLKAAKAALG